MVLGGVFGGGQQRVRPGAKAGRQGGADVIELVRAFPGPALLADRKAVILSANAAAHSLCAELEAGTLPDLRSRIGRVADLQEAVQEAVELGSPESNVLFQLTIMPLAVTGGDAWVLVLGRDATMERNLTTALVASRQMFKDLVECSTDFAWETNAAGRFDFVSPLGALGYTAQELEGRRAQTLCRDEAATSIFETRERMERAEVVLLAKDGEERIYQISARPVQEPTGDWGGARGVAQDVTEERNRSRSLKLAHERLEELSRTDGLTGLLNRRAFLEELTVRLRHQQRHHRPSALLYVDLNNFKSVNDLHGHAAGDAVLQAFGSALQDICRAGDLVARLGGDEFAIWLDDADPVGTCRKADMLRRIGAELHARYGNPQAPLGVSVGIALPTEQDPESIEELLARADVAMYRDKAAASEAMKQWNLTGNGGGRA